MLIKYTGAANSKEIFKYLVGEKIEACFEERSQVWIVLSSGAAICFGAPGGGNPTFWRESPSNVEQVVSKRREQIMALIEELNGYRATHPEEVEEPKPKKKGQKEEGKTAHEQLMDDD